MAMKLISLKQQIDSVEVTLCKYVVKKLHKVFSSSDVQVGKQFCIIQIKRLCCQFDIITRLNVISFEKLAKRSVGNYTTIRNRRDSIRCCGQRKESVSSFLSNSNHQFISKKRTSVFNNL